MIKSISRLCAGTIAFVAFHATVNAQNPTYDLKFEDGTQVNLTLLGNAPENLFSNYVSIVSVSNQIGITNEFSYYKIVPGKYSYKAGFYIGRMSGGFNGLFGSGTYYLGGSETDGEQSITVKSMYTGANTVTKYRAKVPCKKGKYWGLHGEFAYTDSRYVGGSGVPFMYNDALYYVSSVKSVVVAGGIGYNSMKGLRTKADRSEYIGGTRLFTAAADIVINPILGVEGEGQDSVALANPVTREMVSSGMIGFHLYAQSQNMFMYHKKKDAKGGLGIMWRLGVLSYAYIQDNGVFFGGQGRAQRIAPELGIGLFYTFM